MVLTEYLAVFPSTNDGMNDHDFTRTEGREDYLNESGAFDNGEAWSDRDIQEFQNNSGWTDDANLDITSNGLYWFWDSAWGDVHQGQ